MACSRSVEDSAPVNEPGDGDLPEVTVGLVEHHGARFRGSEDSGDGLGDGGCHDAKRLHDGAGVVRANPPRRQQDLLARRRAFSRGGVTDRARVGDAVVGARLPPLEFRYRSPSARRYAPPPMVVGRPRAGTEIEWGLYLEGSGRFDRADEAVCVVGALLQEPPSGEADDLLRGVCRRDGETSRADLSPGWRDDQAQRWCEVAAALGEGGVR